MTRQAFFFPHTPDPEQDPKKDSQAGRVPYEVTGDLIGSNVKAGPFWVMADGFYDPKSTDASGVVGSNQDPCVFSEPWPPFHSFFRLDGARMANERVVGGGVHIADSLALAVKKGDVIIYGKTTPGSGRAIKTHGLGEIWVDTVLVVDSVDPFVASDTSLPGKGTSAYRYNLSDGQPGGMHETSKRDPHLIIRGKISTAKDAVTKLETSFVPLADRTGGVYRTCAVDKGHMGKHWPALCEFFQTQVYGNVGGAPQGGWISRFDSFELAAALLSEIVRRSGGHQNMRGAVAIPPLEPFGVVKRWNPKTKRVMTTT